MARLIESVGLIGSERCEFGEVGAGHQQRLVVARGEVYGISHDL
jgi:hypothetical protein